MDEKPGSPSDSDARREPLSDRVLLIIIAAIVAIAIGGWFVVKRLQQTERVQDCVMRGGRNCAAIPDTANE